MARPRVLTVVLEPIHQLLVSAMSIFVPTAPPGHTLPVLELLHLAYASIVLLVPTLLQLVPQLLLHAIAVLPEHSRRPPVLLRLAPARTVLLVYTRLLLEPLPPVLV